MRKNGIVKKKFSGYNVIVICQLLRQDRSISGAFAPCSPILVESEEMNGPEMTELLPEHQQLND